MRRYAIILLPLLASCGETVTGIDKWRYDKEITLRAVTTSSGGALGDERYRVWLQYKKESRLFFDARNGSHFSVKRDGKIIVIRFCDATIDHASPVWLDEPRDELIHVRVTIDCPNQN